MFPGFSLLAIWNVPFLLISGGAGTTGGVALANELFFVLRVPEELFCVFPGIWSKEERWGAVGTSLVLVRFACGMYSTV